MDGTPAAQARGDDGVLDGGRVGPGKVGDHRERHRHGATVAAGLAWIEPWPRAACDAAAASRIGRIRRVIGVLIEKLRFVEGNGQASAAEVGDGAERLVGAARIVLLFISNAHWVRIRSTSSVVGSTFEPSTKFWRSGRAGPSPARR